MRQSRFRIGEYIAFKDALAADLSHYVPHQPCRNGHLLPRFITAAGRQSQCRACSTADVRAKSGVLYAGTTTARAFEAAYANAYPAGAWAKEALRSAAMRTRGEVKIGVNWLVNAFDAADSVCPCCYSTMAIGGDRPPNLDHLYGLDGDLTPDTARVICARCNQFKSNCTDPEVFEKIAGFYARPLRNILADARQNASDRPMRPTIKATTYYPVDSQRFFLSRRLSGARTGTSHEIGSLTPSDIAWPDRCPVLGVDFDYSFTKHDHSPSIDRIDASRGYVKGNVLVVSWLVNRLKSNATPWELELLAEWMAVEYRKTP